MDEKFKKFYPDKKTRFEVLECQEFFELSPDDLQTVIAIQKLSLPEFCLLSELGVLFYGVKDMTVGTISDNLFRNPVESIAFILEREIPGMYFQKTYTSFENFQKEFPFPSIQKLKDFPDQSFNFSWSMVQFARSQFTRLKESGFAKRSKESEFDTSIVEDGIIWFLNKEAANLYLLVGGK